jgi:uncharacterized protein (TIGR03437 family)
MKSDVRMMLFGCAVLLTIAITAECQTTANSYRVVNLVSNLAGTAASTDPNLLDACGISNANSTFWVSDHGSGLTTLYPATGVPSGTVVKIPGAGGTVGKPTGQLQNSAGAAFTLTNGKSASFIFATEDGLIAAWNTGSASLAEVDVDNSAKLAAMNQDGSTNSPTNATTAGTTVAIYATGEGLTNPAGTGGAIQTQCARAPGLPVKVTIGGQLAQLISAGTPVGESSGVMVVRAVVPGGLTAGPVPVVLSVGSVRTNQNVTISVR